MVHHLGGNMSSFINREPRVTIGHTSMVTFCELLRSSDVLPKECSTESLPRRMIVVSGSANRGCRVPPVGRLSGCRVWGLTLTPKIVDKSLKRALLWKVMASTPQGREAIHRSMLRSLPATGLGRRVGLGTALCPPHAVVRYTHALIMYYQWPTPLAQNSHWRRRRQFRIIRSGHGTAAGW